MTAGFIVAAIALLALVIDTGRLYAAQSDLQKVANVAALDAARVVSGCFASNDTSPGDAARIAARDSIRSNAGQGSGIVLADDQPALGNMTTSNDLRHFSVDFTRVDPDEADTVRVRVTRPAPTPLFNLFSAGQSLTATAAATQRPVGAVQIGSRVLNLDTRQSRLLNGLLSGLLGTQVDLTVADYNKLLDTTINLADLLSVDAGLADIDDLLNTSIRTGAVLKRLGAAAGIPNFADGAQGEVRLGDIINVGIDDDSVAAQVPLNVLGLVSALAQTSASQRQAVVKLGGGLVSPLLGVLNVLPGVDISLDLDLGVVEPPSTASIGRPGYDRPLVGQNTTATGSTNALPEHDNLAARTWASTASVRLNVDLKATLNVPLGVPIIRLDIDLPIYGQIAPSYALLGQINCPSLANQRTTQAVVDTKPGVLRAGVGHFNNVFDPAPSIERAGNLVDLRVIGGRLLSVALPPTGLPLQAVPDETSLMFDGPFVPEIDQPSASNTQPISSEIGASLGNLVTGLTGGINDYVLSGDAFGGLVGGGILNPVTTLLNFVGLDSLLDVVGNIVDSLLSGLDVVLDPILNLLGLGVGQADVTVATVVTNQPQLICTSARDCAEITQPR